MHPSFSGKKVLFTLACLVGSTSAAFAQGSAVNIDAGLLENAVGTAVVPNGGLLQLIASPSGTFSTPTSSSYVSGDNILLASQAMNSNSGTAGETLNAFTLSFTGTPAVVSGEALLLRFYPSLAYASMPSAPTLATTYGQVRSTTIEFGASGGDASETAWVVPASGSADLDYITVNDGGTYANATAYATGIVGAANVPEPSTIFLSSVVALWGVFKLHCRRNQSRQ